MSFFRHMFLIFPTLIHVKMPVAMYYILRLLVVCSDTLCVHVFPYYLFMVGYVSSSYIVCNILSNSLNIRWKCSRKKTNKQIPLALLPPLLDIYSKKMSDIVDRIWFYLVNLYKSTIFVLFNFLYYSGLKQRLYLFIKQ